MVTDNHYRWDFIGLSTDEKPTPATSPKVVDGSTFYCSDNSKLYVYCKDQWYEKTATGGGGTSYTAGDGITIADNTISVDTATIQPKLTAGDNITITDNVISAAAGSGITVLTADDYNANYLNWSDTDPSHFNCVAIFKLPTGVYIFRPVSSMSIRFTQGDGKTLGVANDVIVINRHPETGSEMGQIIYFDGTNSQYITGYTQAGTNATLTNITQTPVDNLTSFSVTRPLSANQGRELKALIDALDQRITALGG